MSAQAPICSEAGNDGDDPLQFDKWDQATLARKMRDSALETRAEMERRQRKFDRLYRLPPSDEPKRPKLADLISAYAATVDTFTSNEVADAIKTPRPSVAPQLARLVDKGVLVIASRRGARHFTYRLAKAAV